MIGVMMMNSENQESQSTVVHHVVAFRFTDTTTPEEIEKIVSAFDALKTQISEVLTLKFGTNNSPEGLNKDCSHAFILTFKNENDRNTYLNHPRHQDFVNLVKPHLDDAFVIDFTA